jgi:hypothetical protein
MDHMDDGNAIYATFSQSSGGWSTKNYIIIFEKA